MRATRKQRGVPNSPSIDGFQHVVTQRGDVTRFYATPSMPPHLKTCSSSKFFVGCTTHIRSPTLQHDIKLHTDVSVLLWVQGRCMRGSNPF